MLRSILSVLAGVIAGMVVIYGVEMLGHYVYPVPEGLDFKDKEAIKAYIEEAPAGALWFVVLAWALGSFAGGLVASVIAKQTNILHALIVGGLLMIAGIINLVSIPHPTWMWIAGLMVYLPFAWLGGVIGSRSSSKSKTSENN